MKQSVFYAWVLILLAVSACKEDEIDPITINFKNTEIGVDGSANVALVFSRPAEGAGALLINVGATQLTYGQGADYYTDPAVENDQISVAYVSGDSEVSFMLSEGDGLNITEDESVTFTLEGSTDLEVGANPSAVVTFGENFVARTGSMEIDGGGSTQPTQVFIDLSKMTQTSVDKFSWDLGFNSGSDNRVILNSTAYVMARALDATDLEDVTATDTAGFGGAMFVPNYYDPSAAAWIDLQTGDLNETAIAEVSSDDAQNMVYIIKRDGEGRNWKKVKFGLSGGDFTVQYADIDATDFESATIARDEEVNFSFLDLDNGEVDVEPVKGAWDIQYSTYSNRANYGALLAVGFNDFITLNRSNVSAVSVSTDAVSYDAFSMLDVSDGDLISNDISVIGSSWRSLVDFSLVLDESIFYVIKDAEGNYYKLRFTSLVSTAGERGYPSIQFDLL